MEEGLGPLNATTSCHRNSLRGNPKHSEIGAQLHKHLIKRVFVCPSSESVATQQVWICHPGFHMWLHSADGQLDWKDQDGFTHMSGGLPTCWLGQIMSPLCGPPSFNRLNWLPFLVLSWQQSKKAKAETTCSLEAQIPDASLLLHSKSNLVARPTQTQ